MIVQNIRALHGRALDQGKRRTLGSNEVAHYTNLDLNLDLDLDLNLSVFLLTILSFDHSARNV